MTTSRNRRTPLPTQAGDLLGPTRVARHEGGWWQVTFEGEDQRRRVFSTKRLPLPDLHRSFCLAIASLTEYDGVYRTLRSAEGAWNTGKRFLRYAASAEPHLRAWKSVTPGLIAGFEEARASASRVYLEIGRLRRLVSALPAADMPDTDTMALLRMRRPHPPTEGVGGYDEGTFRSLTLAALRDAREIISRIERGTQLLDSWRQDPSRLSDQEYARGRALDAIASGHPVHAPDGSEDTLTSRLDLARELYLTYDDLAPLLVLFVAVTGANAETIKELPSEHSVKDDRAVAIELVKRRRFRVSELDMWEIGTGSRELVRPGSLYLAVHALTARGRELARTDRLFAVWTNPHRGGDRTRAGGGWHYPWESTLSQAPLHLSKWAQRHDLREGGSPLRVSSNRIRTSTQVRRTRELGGHLPSAARSNSQEVLFRSYVLPDSTAATWIDEVLDESFADLSRTVTPHAPDHAPHARNGPSHLEGTEGEGWVESTGYLGCKDVLHGPFDAGHDCTQTALICFQCPNAVFAEGNLPAMLSLRDELEQRSTEVSSTDWQARYGTPWRAINEHILPRFNAEQIARARDSTNPRVPLKILERRWND